MKDCCRFCINRNIVECKEQLIADGLKFSQRINRNIVECKDRYEQRSDCGHNVLIETSWNVKHFQDLLLDGWYVGINRNIVECKVCWYRIRIMNFVYVLIETSWNVKLWNFFAGFVLRIVLIETSWNVKIGETKNLSFLLPVLIETSWNVKKR